MCICINVSVYVIIIVDWKQNITAKSCKSCLLDDFLRAPGQWSVRPEVEGKKYLKLPLIHANTKTKRFINRSREYSGIKSSFSKSGNTSELHSSVSRTKK